MVDDKPAFERMVIEETVMGSGLYLNEIKLYRKFLEGTAMAFKENEVNKYLSVIHPKSEYYPILELIYKTPEIDIFLIAEKGEKNGFHMVTTKKGEKTAEIDLWELCGFKDFNELNEKIFLDKRVSAGKSYSFSLFGNNYDSGHYWIDILLNGKIEVEKVEISEWEVP